MSARELFGELGYNLVETTPYMMYYYNEENDIHIWFYNNSKTIEVINEFTLDILQAINQQVNELGWYGKNDNDNLKISYEIKPSFTTRKIKELQQENQKYKEVGNTYKKRCQLAIEYIESKEYEYGDEEQDNYIYDIGFDEVNELLDILKGMK